MTDWKGYTELRTESAPVVGGKPNIWEYTGIKLVDNGLCVFIACCFVILLAVAAYLNNKSPDSGKDFADMAKLCLGVLLGILSQRKKR